jgi:hypothetical protein
MLDNSHQSYWFQKFTVTSAMNEIKVIYGKGNTTVQIEREQQ